MVLMWLLSELKISIHNISSLRFVKYSIHSILRIEP